MNIIFFIEHKKLEQIGFICLNIMLMRTLVSIGNW